MAGVPPQLAVSLLTGGKLHFVLVDRDRAAAARLQSTARGGGRIELQVKVREDFIFTEKSSVMIFALASEFHVYILLRWLMPE